MQHRLTLALVLILVLTGPGAAQQQPATATPVPRAVNRPIPALSRDTRGTAESLLAVVEVTIDRTGAVSHVQAASGEPALVQAAADAARRWHFQAPDVAPVTTLVGINFAPLERINPWLATLLATPANAALRVPTLVRQWGYPAVAVLTPPDLPADPTDTVLDVSIGAAGITRSAYALGPLNQYTLPALQAALAWRFVPKDDGAPWTETVAVTLTRHPQKLKEVLPVYPAAAMKKRLTGQVRVEVVVGVDGRVRDAAVVKSIPELDRAALAAVRRWRFRPALRNGIPIEQKTTIEIAFALK